MMIRILLSREGLGLPGDIRRVRDPIGQDLVSRGIAEVYTAASARLPAPLASVQARAAEPAPEPPPASRIILP